METLLFRRSLLIRGPINDMNHVSEAGLAVQVHVPRVRADGSMVQPHVVACPFCIYGARGLAWQRHS